MGKGPSGNIGKPQTRINGKKKKASGDRPKTIMEDEKGRTFKTKTPMKARS